MKVDEGLLLKVRERWQPLPWAAQSQEGPDLGVDFRQVGPIDVEGIVYREEDGYRFEGSISALVQSSCHRCLRPVELPLKVPINAVFSTAHPVDALEETTTGEEPQKYCLGNERVLDLSPALQDALMPALPMKVLCQKDCQGLCPKCGAFLEEGPCDCLEDQGDPRLAPLLALLNENERPQK